MPKPKTVPMAKNIPTADRSENHAIFCGVFKGKACDMDCVRQEIINAKYGEIIDHD